MAKLNQIFTIDKKSHCHHWDHWMLASYCREPDSIISHHGIITIMSGVDEVSVM